jgi:hypothetical protein
MLRSMIDNLRRTWKCVLRLSRRWVLRLRSSRALYHVVWYLSTLLHDVIFQNTMILEVKELHTLWIAKHSRLLRNLIYTVMYIRSLVSKTFLTFNWNVIHAQNFNIWKMQTATKLEAGSRLRNRKCYRLTYVEREMADFTWVVWDLRKTSISSHKTLF